jgi:hypothetical protein
LQRWSFKSTTKGSSALVVADLSIRLRYLKEDDEIKVIDDEESALFGRVNFPHAHILNNVGAKKCAAEPARTGKEQKSENVGDKLGSTHQQFLAIL